MTAEKCFTLDHNIEAATQNGLNELLYLGVSTVTVYISHQVMKKTGGLYPAPLRILDVSYSYIFCEYSDDYVPINSKFLVDKGNNT